jgi:hypothetical protein
MGNLAAPVQDVRLSPFTVVCELGLKRRETVRYLSVVGIAKASGQKKPVIDRLFRIVPQLQGTTNGMLTAWRL